MSGPNHPSPPFKGLISAIVLLIVAAAVALLARFAPAVLESIPWASLFPALFGCAPPASREELSPLDHQLPPKGANPMLFPLLATLPAQFELMFYVKVLRGLTSLGPFVFRLSDLDALSPLLNAALDGADPDISLELRPAGVFTGFATVNGGVQYVDVYAPPDSQSPCPCRRLPGTGPYVVGDLVTFAAVSETSHGLIPFPFGSATVPIGFLNPIPMAAQILEVTAVLDADTYHVTGITRQFTEGSARVGKVTGLPIVPLGAAGVGSYPIAYNPPFGPNAGFEVDYAWADGSTALEVVYPVGAPVVGPTLLAFLLQLGLVLDAGKTEFGGHVDAQQGGVILMRHETIAFQTGGLAVGQALVGDGTLSVMGTESTPIGTPFAVTNAVAAMRNIYTAVPPVRIVAELLDRVIIAGSYPAPGP